MSNADLLSLTVEHYTPYDVVEAARELMGGIDLDPASCKEANSYIKAGTFYTERDNGLDKQWYCNVFLNAPGRKMQSHLPEFTWLKSKGIKSNSVVAAWWYKLLEEYNSRRCIQAVWIGFNTKQLAYLPELWDYPLCFTTKEATSGCVTGTGRPKFLEWDLESESLKEQGQPTQQGFFAYLPPRESSMNAHYAHVQRFKVLFSQFGRCGVFC